MGEKFKGMAAMMAGQAPNGIPIPAGIPNVLAALYAAGIMGTSPVDEPKNKLFHALLLWHSGKAADDTE